MNKQPVKLVSHGSAIALGSLEVARLLAIHGVCPATSLVAILDVVCRGGWSVRFHPFPELLPVGAGYEFLEDPSAVLVVVLRELYQEFSLPPPSSLGQPPPCESGAWCPGRPPRHQRPGAGLSGR